MDERTKRRLPLVPAAILAIVALTQRALLLTTALTPWMGGGFSMFTTVDGINARHLRCFVTTSAGEIAIAAPNISDDILDFPTTAPLRQVARGILVARPAATRARAEVWSFRFDRDRGVAIAFPGLSAEAER